MVATTAPRPFRDWLQAQLELRGIVGVGEAGRVLGISQSMMSRYLAGLDRPSRKNVVAIAGALGVPVAEVQDAVDADPRRLQQLHPPPAVQDQLAEIRRALTELAAAVAAGPLPVAEGPLPVTRMLEAARPWAGPPPPAAMVPAVLRAPHPLPVAMGADRVVVWIVDASGPQIDAWVRVGDREADPPDVKRWEAPDDVTGVVAIVQVVPRA